MEEVLGSKYKILEKIGGGSFGEIFLAKNVNTGEEVAVKAETVEGTNNHHNDKKKKRSSQLKRESKIYVLLEGEVGISRIRWLSLGPQKNLMVMDLLGKSLEDLFNYCNRKFSLKTTLVIAYELLCRIETVHTKSKIIHRDIKPENFLMGRGRDRHTVYIIDFGLSKLYCNPKTNHHIKLQQGYSLTGTARYASVNAHLGIELSRRDDLISIGYLLVYFMKGCLPWQGLHGEGNEEKYRKILEKKQATTLSELCEGLPAEFQTYLEAVECLSFEETPNYTYLKGLFRQLFISSKFTYENILYDWEVLAYERTKQSQK